MNNFRNGIWMWDDKIEGLAYVTKDLPGMSSTSLQTQAQTGKYVTTDMKFKETVDNLEQVRFRRHFQRRCKPDEPEVITVQDVKDVALFIAYPKDLTKDFLQYFHIPTMDRFLRALIVYFQYYLQVWENMMARREEAKRKLWQPVVTELENIVRDDLADLRSMVAREYCSILLGIDDARQFHHMNNKNSTSLSDKDRRLFEVLICMSIRVVWVALQRKYLNLIELEMNRLLRSEIFNIKSHHMQDCGAFKKTPGENRVLVGTADLQERKLLRRSPAAKEIIFENHDYRMLLIGIMEAEPESERVSYLEAAYAAPEELLEGLKVTVGVLGFPREELDAMMMPKERTSQDIAKAVRVIPEFKLPPRITPKDTEVPPTFPAKPCQYAETSQTKTARIHQRNIWLDYVSYGGDIHKEQSVMDTVESQKDLAQLQASISAVIAQSMSKVASSAKLLEASRVRSLVTLGSKGRLVHGENSDTEVSHGTKTSDEA